MDWIFYMKNNRQDGFYLDGRYSAKKIEENVDAEIMCVVAEDARESYKEDIIWTLEVYIYIYIYIYIHPAHTLVSTLNLRYPHGGVRPFHQKSTCLTQLTLGPYVVQIWSRNTPESGANETLVLHRVGGWAGEANKVVPPSPFAASLSPSPQVVSRYPLEPPLLAFLLGTDPHRNSWSGFTTPSEVALQNHLEWLYKTICQWPVPSRACRGSLPD